MTTESCWCCEAQMKNAEIPFTNRIIYWCHHCQPDFDVITFAADYNFDA